MDELLSKLEALISKNIPISPQEFLEYAEKLVVLMGAESDKLFRLQREVAEYKVNCIEQATSVAEAKLRAESTPLYEEMQKQKAKLERVNEMIRIAKIQARQRNEEYFGNKLN